MFRRHFVTVNETRIHRYRPETKEQSKEWTLPGECASKKAKTVLSAPGQWQNDHSAVWCLVNGAVRGRIAEKWPHLVKKIVIFHHYLFDGLLRYDQIGLLTVAPSTVFCRFGPIRIAFYFQTWKISIAGQKLESHEKVMATRKPILQSSRKRRRAKEVKASWDDCIELKGDFFCRLSTYPTTHVH